MSELDFGKVPEGTFFNVMSYIALGVIGVGLAAAFVYGIIELCLAQMRDRDAYREYEAPQPRREEERENSHAFP